MVQIQEASRSDLMVRLVAAAARDHGPAVFVLGASAEELLIADVIVRHRVPAELVAVGPESDVVHAYMTRLYELDPSRVRAVDSLPVALFGRNARITAARGSAGSPLQPYEYDCANGMLKFNPLAGWSDADVRACLGRRGVGHAPQ